MIRNPPERFWFQVFDKHIFNPDLYYIPEQKRVNLMVKCIFIALCIIQTNIYDISHKNSGIFRRFDFKDWRMHNSFFFLLLGITSWEISLFFYYWKCWVLKHLLLWNIFLCRIFPIVRYFVFLDTFICRIFSAVGYSHLNFCSCSCRIFSLKTLSLLSFPRQQRFSRISELIS